MTLRTTGRIESLGKEKSMAWMKRGSMLLAVLVAPTVTGLEESAAAAQAPAPDARALVAGAMAYVAGLDSLAVDMAMGIRSVEGEDTQEFSVTSSLLFAGARKLLMHVTSPNAEFQIVSDGERLFLYKISDKSYSELDAPPSRQEVVGMMAGGAIRMGSLWLAGFLHDDAALFEHVHETEYLGIEPVDGGTTLGHHVRLASADHDVDLWLRTTGPPLLLRLRMDAAKMLSRMPASGAPDSIELNFNLSNWQPNVAAPPERFAFEPPEGVTRETLPQQAQTDALVGKPAPNFSLALLEGGEMDLAGHKGKDIVIVEFWASWCGPCRISLPVVAKVAGAYKDKGVAFYAVNLREPPELVRGFLEQMNLSLPVALDKDGSVGGQYGANSIPRMVIVGKDGIVHEVHAGVGPSLEKELTAELDALLEGGQAGAY